MPEHQDLAESTSPREQDLEIEIARLRAEVEFLRGENPAAATTTLLEIASATVDNAVAEARREAEEIRADCLELEGFADIMRAEVAEAQALIDGAAAEADGIVAAARNAGEEIVAEERARVADEVAGLAEVRAMLADERDGLEREQEDLRRQVADLRESVAELQDAAATIPDASPADTDLFASVATSVAESPSAVPPADTEPVEVPSDDPELVAVGTQAGPVGDDHRLTEALAKDDSDDHAFRQFLDGDDAPDKSRDWLLRSEQS